jgi:hypothetical protein
MITATSIHTGSTPPAPPETEGAVAGLQVQSLGQARHSTPPVGDVGGSPSRRSPERERPEDDEAVITAVLAAVTHRSARERPEDDEVVLTYTREPACRHVR